MANKWLIVKNKFLWSASIKYHNELLAEGLAFSDVAGGGYWYLDRASRKMYLYGSSDEFGQSSKGKIIDSLNRTLFPMYLDGIEFHISHSDDLGQVISTASQICPDWIYDYSVPLIVDEDEDEYKQTPSYLGYPAKLITGGYQTMMTHHPKGVTELAPKQAPRNSECPCGSGKKFKKCCINKK